MVIDLLIKNARIFIGDPGDVYEGCLGIENGKIVAITKDSSMIRSSDVFDAKGLLVIPGLIDVDTHFRVPGMTHKEDFLLELLRLQRVELQRFWICQIPTRQQPPGKD